jgi:nitrate/nitrite transporter NarK
MTAEATEVLERQLTAEQLEVAPVGAVRTAMLRGDVVLLSVQYFFWSVGVYGFVLWLPTIIRRGGSFSMGSTGLLAAVPYLVAIVLMVMVAHASDKTLNRKSFVWPFLLLAGVAMFSSYLFSERSFVVSFVSLVISGACMYAPYATFFAMVPERLPRNVTAEVLALVNCSGALGGFFGSYFVGFLQGVTGNSRAGFLLMSLSLMLSAVILVALPKAPAAAMRRTEIE